MRGNVQVMPLTIACIANVELALAQRRGRLMPEEPKSIRPPSCLGAIRRQRMRIGPRFQFARQPSAIGRRILSCSASTRATSATSPFLKSTPRCPDQNPIARRHGSTTFRATSNVCWWRRVTLNSRPWSPRTRNPSRSMPITRHSVRGAFAASRAQSTVGRRPDIATNGFLLFRPRYRLQRRTLDHLFAENTVTRHGGITAPAVQHPVE